MDDRPSNLHVLIVSWPGWHDKARFIASELVGHVSRVSVVYSDPEGKRETGAGYWFSVPQEDYFGRKFKALIDRVAPEETALLIQADATCDDWAGLARRCMAAFARHADIGLWAPLIDAVAFPLEDVAVRSRPNSQLVEVLHTDGIVVGFSPRVTQRFHTLNFSGNNLGWGIDWVAIAYAVSKGLVAVIDPASRVRHPKSRGYDGDAAKAQMEQFLWQLTPDERAICDRLKATVALHNDQRTRRSHLCLSTSQASGPQQHQDDEAFKNAISLVSLHKGKLGIAVSPDLDPPQLRTQSQQEIALVPTQRPVLPQALRLSPPNDVDLWVTDVSGKEWSCPGQNTLSIAFPLKDESRKVRLIDAFTIPVDWGDVTILAGLATHRANADLLIEWHDPDDPAAAHSVYVKFDPAFSGRKDLGDYQALRLRLPATGAARTLSLTLCLWSTTSTGSEPGIILLTQPMLVASADTEAPTVPLLKPGFDPDSTKSAWLEASLPSDSGTVEVLCDGRWVHLLQPIAATVQLIRRGSHLFAVADERCAVTLCIDGRATRLLWLSPIEVDLDLPEPLVMNPNRAMELRDMTGSVVLAKA